MTLDLGRGQSCCQGWSFKAPQSSRPAEAQPCLGPVSRFPSLLLVLMLISPTGPLPAWQSSPSSFPAILALPSTPCAAWPLPVATLGGSLSPAMSQEAQTTSCVCVPCPYPCASLCPVPGPLSCLISKSHVYVRVHVLRAPGRPRPWKGPVGRWIREPAAQAESVRIATSLVGHRFSPGH